MATYLAKFSTRAWGLIALVVALIILIALAGATAWRLLPDGTGTLRHIERTQQDVQLKQDEKTEELNGEVAANEEKVERRTYRAVARVVRPGADVHPAFVRGLCESNVYRDDPKCSGRR